MLVASCVVSNYGLCAARGRCSFPQRKLEKLFSLSFGLELDVKTNCHHMLVVDPGYSARRHKGRSQDFSSGTHNFSNPSVPPSPLQE